MSYLLWGTILTAKIGVIGHPHSTLIVIFCHGNLSSTAGSMSVWLITIVFGRRGVIIVVCKVPTSIKILKTKIICIHVVSVCFHIIII